MADLDEIKKLTNEFLLKILLGLNQAESLITETLAVDTCNQPKDIHKRVKFFKYFSKFNLQPKIELTKIVLENNYPKISKIYPKYFSELNQLKGIRNSIAHNTLAYYGDNPQGKGGKLFLSHSIIKKQRTFTKTQMKNLMKKMDKILNETREIRKLVGKSNGLNF